MGVYGSNKPGEIVAVSGDPPREEKPHYYYTQEERSGASNLFMVICDEGWRTSIVCDGAYEWAARWLVEQLQGKPYAPELRP